MLRNFPLLAIPVFIYNALAFGNGALSKSAQTVVESLGRKLFSVPMATGAEWNITTQDVLLFVALVLVFAEFIKTAREGREAIINHTLSLALFILCLIEFLLIPAFASSLFFIITTMALLDVVAGYMITVIYTGGEPEPDEDYVD